MSKTKEEDKIWLHSYLLARRTEMSHLLAELETAGYVDTRDIQQMIRQFTQIYERLNS